MYKVKEVAEIAGVSVRTLHHYDHIGLLSPQHVTDKGYRLYGEEGMARLQQILFFKEMDFSLQKIKKILDDPHFDEKQALSNHKEILMEKKIRLERIIHSVDQTLESVQGGENMANEDRFKPFDRRHIEEHQKKYEKEVKERWGQTDAYKESKRKTSSYTDEDWKRIQEESNEIDRQIVDRMSQGPEDEEVQRLIGEKRQHITDYFYECNTEIFCGLADMYVNDPRFTKNIDKWAEGYAEFLRDAMHIYCDRLDG
ncbi:MerR family transcriptional regulator [Halobacillus litoralis]|uniref:MerR family transcriptional regulator n=1 Tax=Halobacillus litoralis TaxID=45668 RepID=A0A410MCT5_9BACI|nr:MerR family transcriptional regulator [Halobacillus litoralis]QAS52539.1 MerR family transcriptional regulator [Halobacillus litoralis]